MTRTTEQRVEILRRTLLRSSSRALEILAAEFVGRATGYRIRVASSGAQSGGDAGSQLPTPLFRIETKRYGNNTRLDERELIGEIRQAVRRDPDLEIWILLTTQPVSEQIASSLVREGADIGLPIQIFDWAGSLPNLARLCAACPDLVDATCGRLASVAAKSLAQEFGVGAAMEDLKVELESWSAGWALTADLSRESMFTILHDPQESRAFFRQNLSVGAPKTHAIVRQSAADALDSWYQSFIPSCGLIVIGDEGRGKSWALASWLLALPRPECAVLFCSAAEFRDPALTTLEDVLARALYIRCGKQSELYWRRRLERYKNSAEPSTPRLWLVIDGLNESLDMDWPGILLHAQREVWKSRIRITTTCRTQYFAERLERQVEWASPPRIVEVRPFTDEERHDVLGRLGVDSAELAADVLELARIPRICRLVARLATRLEGAQRVTYESLLFEYGKRFDPASRSSISADTWHAFLRELATSVRSGITEVKRSELRKWLDVGELGAVEAALGDIIDGLLVKPVENSPGTYEFDRELVLAANGLALWSLLDAAAREPEADIGDLLNQELEPLDGLDDRARIVRGAVAAAILSGISDDATHAVLTGLLVFGLTDQNVSRDDLSSYFAHIEHVPRAYVDALESLARSDRHDEAAMTSAELQSKSSVPAVRNAMSDSVTHWVHFVSLGITGDARQADRDERRKKELIRWLGQVPQVGALNVLGTILTFEAGYSSHRLTDYALQLLQAMEQAPEKEFWWRFGLANVLSDDHNALTSAGWVVQLNREDYDETRATLRSIADELVQSAALDGASDSLSERAAAKLCWLPADCESDRIARTFVPEPDGWARAKSELDNPANSVFQLYPCQVAETLKVSTQPLQRIIRRVGRWWGNPMIEIPDGFPQKVVTYISSLDLSEVGLGISTTRADHDLEMALPCFSRCAADHLSPFVGRLLSELDNRDGKNWASLAHVILDLSLVLVDEHRAIVLRQLERDDLECEDSHQIGRARSALACMAHAPKEHVGFVRTLIGMRIGTMHAQLASRFGTLTGEELDQLLTEVTAQGDVEAHWILVNLLIHSDTPIGDAAANFLLKLTDSKQAGLRLHALYALSFAENAKTAKEFAQTGWTWHAVENDAERRHGSDILLSVDPPLPVAEQLARVAPWRLPKAASIWGPGPEAALIAKTITGLLGSQSDPPRHIYDEVVHQAQLRITDPLGKLSLEEPDDWGDQDQGLSRIFQPQEQLDELRKAEQAALYAIAKHRSTNRALYGEWIRIEYLDVLLAAAPEELKHWLQGARETDAEFSARIRNAAGFYLSLCRLLLARDLEEGIKLWRAMDTTPHLTRFIGDAGIDWRLLIAFEAEDTPVARQFWDELYDIPRARTDRDLFDVVLAAELGGQSSWLTDSIAADASSPLPWQQHRAVLVSSFRISPSLDQSILHSSPGLLDSRQHVERLATNIASRGVWQRHWLIQFATAESNVKAFSDFVLFLTQVDRRWSLNLQRIVDDGVEINEQRLQFLRSRRSDVDRKAKKVDGDLAKVFLGRPASNTVWPWSFQGQ